MQLSQAFEAGTGTLIVHDDLRLPELTFPKVTYGPNETPWDLRVLLYEGGAAARAEKVHQLIASGELGDPQFDRLELVEKLHEEINGRVEAGGARYTTYASVYNTRLLFGFAERKCLALTLSEIVGTFCAWADSLFHRTRLKKSKNSLQVSVDKGPLAMASAYECAACVAKLLDVVLERHTSVMELTRLRRPKQRASAIGIEAEKQSLSDTFAFGHLLQDICDALDIATLRSAPLPIRIPLPSCGKVLIRIGPSSIPERLEHSGLNERYPLANLRIEAELLMFLGQTGMNLSQAAKLQVQEFFYVSHLDGYEVKRHKGRRNGAVLFEIYKDYKLHFERYLEWRRTIFPNSKMLFPFIGLIGTRLERKIDFPRMKAVCAEVGVPFVGPRLLRNTRVNWLLRRSGDADLTGEMAQNTQETLRRDYKKPSLQRALTEAVRFWGKYDPHVIAYESVAPGACSGDPQASADRPSSAARPDCQRASGCLWCTNHRDVDSLDHVWALTTFAHLKTIELSKSRPQRAVQEELPAKIALDRIQEKLKWFHDSNEVRKGWVVEAEERVEEGDFHADFRSVIAELEARQ